MAARVRHMYGVVSSSILAIGFDPTLPGVDRGMLAVQFVNYDVYTYENVAWVDYLTMLNSPSIGSAFALLIKSRYRGTKVHSEKDAHLVANLAKKPAPKEEDNAPMFDVMDSSTSTKRKS